jgi:hypothetical protein
MEGRAKESANDAPQEQKYLARIIRGSTAIEAQPFRSEGKAALP